MSVSILEKLHSRKNWKKSLEIKKPPKAKLYLLQIEGWHCQIACLKNFLYFDVKFDFFSLLKLLLCYTLGRYISAINKFRSIFTSTLSEKKILVKTNGWNFYRMSWKVWTILSNKCVIIFWFHIVSFWTFFIVINFNYLLAGSVFGSLQLLAFQNECVCT